MSTYTPAGTAENRNPGSFEEIHRKTQDIFPICFEGAKLAVQKGLSSHFQVAHTLSLSSMQSGYRFGATYVGTKQLGEGESYPVMLGDTDATGNTTMTMMHMFGERYKGKVQASINKGAIAGAQGTMERRAEMYTLGLTMGDTDIVNESGVAVVNYLRRLTPKLDVGVEYLYGYGKNIPAGKFSNLTYGFRYNAPFWTGAVTCSDSRFHASYFHRQTPFLAFGCEFTADTRHGDAVATVGYQADLPEEGVTLRAHADTNWTVGAVMEKKLSPALPFTLALSGLFNHVKNSGKFGIGLIIG